MQLVNTHICHISTSIRLIMLNHMSGILRRNYEKMKILKNSQKLHECRIYHLHNIYYVKFTKNCVCDRNFVCFPAKPHLKYDFFQKFFENF